MCFSFVDKKCAHGTRPLGQAVAVPVGLLVLFGVEVYYGHTMYPSNQTIHTMHCNEGSPLMCNSYNRASFTAAVGVLAQVLTVNVAG